MRIDDITVNNYHNIQLHDLGNMYFSAEVYYKYMLWVYKFND